MKEEEKQRLIDLAYQIAYDNDLSYGFCPQCVISALQEVTDDIPDELIKAAHGLSGGVCLSGEGTCGALTGGILALSNKYGRSIEQFGKTKALKNLTLGKELIEQFKAKYGDNITCKGVQTKISGRSYNNWDPEEAEAFKNSPCKKACAEVTGDVAKWVAEMIIL